jgi:hypothetical protein
MSDEAAARAIELAFRQLNELDTLHVYGGRARASMLGYGPWARIVRTGEAIRQLHTVGFDHEAAPLGAWVRTGDGPGHGRSVRVDGGHVVSGDDGRFVAW